VREVLGAPDVLAVQEVEKLVQERQDLHPDVRLVVVGDFNAYEFSDGYVDAVGQIAGKVDPSQSLFSGPDLVDPDLDDQALFLPPAERYSFVFAGSAQLLDHALTSQGLGPWVRGLEYGHGNSDAPEELIEDAQTLLRSSDHDGLVLFVMGDSDGDGVADDEDACPATRLPEPVPLRHLGLFRFALVDTDSTFDTRAFHGPRPSRFTLEGTSGCSCGQILDRTRGRQVGEELFGCTASTLERWIRGHEPHRWPRGHRKEKRR
jgi:hypothetical protein